MAEPGQIVEPVGIDHRQRGRQHLVGQVMVDHDDVEAEPLRLGERLVAGGAAIDRHEQRRASARRAPAPPRRSGRSLRKSGPGYGSADRARRGAGSAPASRPRSHHRHRSRRRSRRSRRAPPRRRCATPPPPCRRAYAGRASAPARSDRGSLRPPRPRRRARRGCAPAVPARCRAAARSPAPAPRRARRAGRARRGRKPNARRRETGAVSTFPELQPRYSWRRLPRITVRKSYDTG